jgi:hypothetical protein
MVVSPKELQILIRNHQSVVIDNLERRLDEIITGKILSRRGTSYYLSVQINPENEFGEEYKKLNLEYKDLLLKKYEAAGWEIDHKTEDRNKETWNFTYADPAK